MALYGPVALYVIVSPCLVHDNAHKYVEDSTVAFIMILSAICVLRNLQNTLSALARVSFMVWVRVRTRVGVGVRVVQCCYLV